MVVRILLWIATFLIPALFLQVPVPHTLYLIVPAFVAVDGLRQGGMRRVLVWVLLSLVYEMVYQLPLGVFALTILSLAILHAGFSQVIRVDIRVHAGRWRPIHLLRSLFVALLWMVGMIIISTALNAILGFASPFSWHALFVVWVSHGAMFGAVGILAIILGILFWERTLRLEKVFSDYALIQTTDVPD